MTTPETLALMAALRDGGVEARFIGGCVRDAILKRPVRDIDIATPTPPERVMEVLQAADIRVIPTGIDHGTVTAVLGHHHYEITTLRIDVQTDGRRARVAFTDDWTQDAARRDFTINTMSANEDGDVFDPYGGLEDLGRGKVRFVGDAEKRINEDVLRLLRFFRFYAEYAKPPINVQALATCRKLAPRLVELSGERVRGELFRILMAPNPADTILLMRAEKVLEHFLPEAGDVGRLRALAWLLERGIKLEGVDTNPVRRLAALMDPSCTSEDGDALSARLRFSKTERLHLRRLIARPVNLNADTTDSEIRHACYRWGKDLVIDLSLLAWASEIAVTPRQKADKIARWDHILRSATTYQPVTFPLKGRDGLKLGFKAGPTLGDALDRVEAWWIEGDFRFDRQACLDQLGLELTRIQADQSLQQ